MTEQELRSAVRAEALRWVGTPYHHGADVLGQGVDCLMLLVRVYHAVGLIPDIDPRPYAPDWQFHRNEEIYLGGLETYCEQTDDLGVGNICMWKFGRTYSHSGIYMGDGVVCHAWRDVREVTLTELHYPKLATRQRLQYRLKDWGAHGR